MMSQDWRLRPLPDKNPRKQQRFGMVEKIYSDHDRVYIHVAMHGDHDRS